MKKLLILTLSFVAIGAGFFSLYSRYSSRIASYEKSIATFEAQKAEYMKKLEAGTLNPYERTVLDDLDKQIKESKILLNYYQGLQAASSAKSKTDANYIMALEKIEELNAMGETSKANRVKSRLP